MSVESYLDILKQWTRQPEEKGTALAHAMGFPPERIEKWELGKVYFKPGGDAKFRLTAWYADDGGRKTSQGFSGKIFSQPISPADTLPGPENGLVKPPLGNPVGICPEINARLWADPNDPELPARRIFENAENLRQLLNQPEIKSRFSTAFPASAGSRLVKYVPGNRAVYRLSSQDTGERVFVKITADPLESMATAYRKLSECPAVRDRSVRIPRFILFHPSTNSLWQEALAGESLADCFDQIPLVDIAAEIGRQAALFQRCELNLPLRWTPETMIAQLGEFQEKFARTLPKQNFGIRELTARLIDFGRALPTPGAVLLHGSFKMSHVFYDETTGGIQFIDLDSVCRGDAAYDPGRFIAHLLKLQASGKLNAETGMTVIGRLTDSFRHHHFRPVNPASIYWYAAAEFFNSQIYKLIKRNKMKALANHLDVATAFLKQYLNIESG